jgi:mannose-6-phosphate isomerase
MEPTYPLLYPLLFDPIYKAKVWGGRTLTKLGRSLPDGDINIGESWELADLASTSASGGGGGAERSKIASGPLTGLFLNQAIARYGPALMGKLQLTPTGGFPILIKYLDAKENLSVQVHPSPEYARAHPEAHLKSEAWYILDAQPDAAIYKGIHAGVTPQQFRDAVRSGQREAVEPLMIRVPVKPGDCHYLPSGTCHALGAGVLVAEVQTPSDTTFRVYDWGRTDRELHIEQALQCIHFGPPDVRMEEKRSHIAGMFTTVSRLVTCDYFRIEKIRMSAGYAQDLPYDQPAVWMVLQGKGTITPRPGEAPIEFSRGQTLLIPANLSQARVALQEDTVWLEVTFPQALPEQIA